MQFMANLFAISQKSLRKIARPVLFSFLKWWIDLKGKFTNLTLPTLGTNQRWKQCFRCQFISNKQSSQTHVKFPGAWARPHLGIPPQIRKLGFNYRQRCRLWRAIWLLCVDQFKGASIKSEVQVGEDLVSVKDWLVEMLVVRELVKELLFLCKKTIKKVRHNERLFTAMQESQT